MQSIVDGLTNLFLGIVLMLVMPAVPLLVLRRFAPFPGEALWRGYCRLLTWLVVAPIRLIRNMLR